MSPNKPKTPIRGIRVPDEVWKAAQAEADRRGESVSDAVRRCLEEYTRKADRKRDER